MTNRHCPHAPADECGWPSCSCVNNPDLLAAAKGTLIIPGACFVALVAIAIVGFLLSGCASDKGLKVPPAEKPVATVTVSVPVAKSCVPPAMPVAPAWAATPAKLKAATAAEDRYQMLAAFFLQAWPWISKADPVIQGCR